jgi:hypothetical protein
MRFNTQNIFRQWLDVSKPWPNRTDRFLIPANWILCGFTGLYFASIAISDRSGNYSARNYEIETIIVMLGGVELFFVLPFSIFADFMFFTPMIIHNIRSTAHLTSLYHAPIPSAEITGDLRRWAIKTNWSHLAPVIICGLGCLAIIFLSTMGDYALSSTDWMEFFRGCLIFLLPFLVSIFCLYLFLLYSGLSAAALPSWVSRSGLMIIGWILPVLAIVLIGGSILAQETWDRYQAFMYGGGDFYAGYYRPPSAYRMQEFMFAWYIAHYMIILVPVILIAVRQSLTLFEKRRHGAWL